METNSNLETESITFICSSGYQGPSLFDFMARRAVVGKLLRTERLVLIRLGHGFY